MGIARVRPSRNIYEFSFDVTKLPDAVSKACTIELTALPNRGILHRISLIARDVPAIDGTDVHAFLLSSIGTVTSTAGGDAAVTTAELDKAVYLTSFREADAPVGGLDLDSTAGVLNQLHAAHIELLGPQGITEVRPPAVAYDVSGAVLGPDASDGVMYAIIAGGAALTDLTKLVLRLEIEPCF